MLKYDFHRGWYLSTNGTIANVVLCYLDLNFQGHKFELLISWKQLELLQKCVKWLLQRLIFAIEYTIVNVVLRDSNINFQCQIFSCYAFVMKKSVYAADVPCRFASTRLAHRGVARVSFWWPLCVFLISGLNFVILIEIIKVKTAHFPIFNMEEQIWCICECLVGGSLKIGLRSHWDHTTIFFTML